MICFVCDLLCVRSVLCVICFVYDMFCFLGTRLSFKLHTNRDTAPSMRHYPIAGILSRVTNVLGGNVRGYCPVTLTR